MALVKNGELVTSSFVDASGAEALPATGPVIVSLDQWKAHRDELLKRGTPLGIRLHSDQPPELIAADVQHFAVVALEFPKFRDGRAYSYARLLRERYSFKGELRAVGEVLLEQLFFMRPLPAWSRYRTPIDGLYLCGAGTHPGGGVTGAPGFNAARRILSDLPGMKRA